MNTRYLMASALAAALVAPDCPLGAEAGAGTHRVQDGEMLRHREGRQERLRIDRQQLVWGGSSKLNSDPKAWISPSRPCLAEYGDGFPRYLGAHPGGSLPYLAQFAELEWHLGRLALATEESPNVHYLHLDWALDELIGIYLTDTAPEQYALRQEDVWLEIRGLRGELQMTRLTVEEVARRMAALPTGAVL